MTYTEGKPTEGTRNCIYSYDKTSFQDFCFVCQNLSIKRQSNIFPKFDGNLRPSIMWWTEPVETWEKWPAADPQVLMSFCRHSGRYCHYHRAAAVAAHILWSATSQLLCATAARRIMCGVPFGAPTPPYVEHTNSYVLLHQGKILTLHFTWLLGWCNFCRVWKVQGRMKVWKIRRASSTAVTR